MSEDLAPIVLFVYNRLEHTKKTVSALKRNILSNLTDLYIYSDFGKDVSTINEVEEVRKYIHSISGFKSINIIEQTTNQGLAKSIIQGVTEVVNAHGKVIVLEDDIVTSPFFLKYMNDSLDKYCKIEKVMSISAGNYPVDLSCVNSDTFFLRIPLCWGWATWKDRWKDFNRDLSLVNSLSNSEVRYMNFDDSHNFFQQAEFNLSGKLNTWFIFWYILAVKKNKLTLFPKERMCTNIGFDGTGQNCSKTNEFQFESSTYDRELFLNNIVIEENRQAFIAYKKFFLRIKVNILRRVIRRGRNIFYGIFK